MRALMYRGMLVAAKKKGAWARARRRVIRLARTALMRWAEYVHSGLDSWSRDLLMGALCRRWHRLNKRRLYMRRHLHALPPRAHT